LPVPPSGKLPQETRRPEAQRSGRPLFALTIFLSAFLLFQLQPLMGKYILPWFGGAPAVWTTCLLFFQALLLAGYSYAHVLARRAGKRSEKAHLAVLAVSAAVLVVLALFWPSPITPGAGWKPTGSETPVRDILLLLSAGVGLPYLLLASTGPLLQHWFARSFPGSSPYRLYAVSNLGSLLGLVSYPFVFEPLLTLRAQAWLWSGGYVVFALGSGAGARIAGAAPEEVSRVKDARADDAPPPARFEPLLWFALAACGSLLLLATTNVMTQDVAAVPLLWILPLSLYLLSFILCFGNWRWYRRGLYHPVFGVAVVMAVLALFRQDYMLPVPRIGIFALALFAGCMVLHGELSRRKSAPRFLTWYYLMIAAGGAFGGAFTTLVAPHLFPAFWEFHLGLWLCALLLGVALFFDPRSWFHDCPLWLAPALALGTALIPGALVLTAQATMGDPFQRWNVVAVVALSLLTFYAWLRGRRKQAVPKRFRWIQGCALGWLLLLGYVLQMHARWQPGSLIARSRNFYGVLSVWEKYRSDPLAHAYEEIHARTTHGMQLQTPGITRTATSYYSVRSGVGLALLYHPRRLETPPQSLRVGAVGLGVGTVAVYAQPGDSFRFYEINPEVIRFSGQYFSYLSQCQGSVTVVPGDARLSLEREAERGELQQFDVLVLDAFTGDAIPVHLLTDEAFALYLRHLRPLNGILAIHISNRALDLEPVVARLAEHYGLYSTLIHAPEHGTSVLESDWILLSYNPATLATPEIALGARPLKRAEDAPLWTDQYSNLLSVLK
jgi:spermidine synthase